MRKVVDYTVGSVPIVGPWVKSGDKSWKHRGEMSLMQATMIGVGTYVMGLHLVNKAVYKAFGENALEDLDPGVQLLAQYSVNFGNMIIGMGAGDMVYTVAKDIGTGIYNKVTGKSDSEPTENTNLLSQGQQASQV